MRQAQDIVWNTITESAKRRFDYAEFKNSLSELGDDERTAEYIIFQIVVGYAEGLSVKEVLSKVTGDLLLFGCLVSNDELIAFLADKKEILNEEICAAEMALEEFDQGASSDIVLAHVRSLLP